ncbi:MAG: bifunctional 5,10-methylenetetrahydrofolate dehydrogenase/5,10-methenyltetrahydrofolate cyclohydrolase [Promethearchaeota archaeon]|nr:MAG: bifunctional 5,10-methylenetetrahydrofolate dehydrogenase/5,10-methenyltetrahydrofolate cyclohydrolase [Candidatus Lokiarchaeota archaeon]
MDKLLDGKKLAEQLNLNLKEDILKTTEKTGIKPKLATILVGENLASEIYINIKRRVCAEVGIESVSIKLKEDSEKNDLIKLIKQLNNDKTVHGILLQLPLPPHLREYTSYFIEKISSLKDVDGLHPLNRGKLFDYDEEYAPCTPKGIIKILEHYNIDLKGKNVVIINRSNLVGKPLIFLMLKRNATVTICHTSTINIEEITKKADVLVIAVGIPNFINKSMIKKGAIIIDVGTNRVNGKLTGDVDFNDVYDKCNFITPNPGGIGPLTVAFLMQNTFIAYKKQIKI